MAKIIDIVNGTGTGEFINDTYSVTANVTGYDNSSILPSSVDVLEGVDTYSFTIAATGTLTLHVTEDGTSTGTPIVGATFVRTDCTGVTYGSPITTDSNGDAVFSNVPFATTGAPVIYFRQTASDGDHECDGAIQNTTMTTSDVTLQIENSVGAVRTITLMDANYENLMVDSATLTFTN